MTQAEIEAAAASLSPGAIEAMDALFAFAKAMEAGVTAADLRDVMALAVADGFDMLEIALAMAVIATQEARKRQNGAAPP